MNLTTWARKGVAKRRSSSLGSARVEGSWTSLYPVDVKGRRTEQRVMESQAALVALSLAQRHPDRATQVLGRHPWRDHERFVEQEVAHGV